MKRNIPRLIPMVRARITRILDGILSAASLLFALISASHLSAGQDSVREYFIVYVLIFASNLIRAFDAFKKDNQLFTKLVCCAAIYLVSGVVFVFIGFSIPGIVILMESFFASVLTGRIFAIIKKRKLRSSILNILISILIAVLMVESIFVDTDNAASYLLVHIIFVSGMMLGHIISISFYQMRFSVLKKILRKTFAAEILFGLLLLIVSFSFVFQTIEPGISTYIDALWYCFAVVTTIGFGDLTVLSPFSRALSVILGVYGIVVVALVTSVIVNFYNEVKDEKSDDEKEEVPPKEEATELDAPKEDNN
ncbi:MAG: two pore domain potassium channel family protein [Clostridia bacterium]|nr:two pore domain potassium channel family protein [Clostridia bacterium]